ncbi:hypothetical protein BGZ73_005986 [Actinomortierella ambigua]|nr:hypothetical protein BGZ73_005986 [Actinomortierella ambigua]
MTSAPRHFGYTAKFSVGTYSTPSSQYSLPPPPMNLLVDTGSDLIVVTSALCDAEDCLLVPHKFDCSKSLTCSSQDLVNPDRRYRQTYGDGTVAVGTILRDSISFQAADGRKICVPEQSMLVVDQAGLNLTRSYGRSVDGIVGLNLGSPAIRATLLQNLQRIQGMATERGQQPGKLQFSKVSPSAPLGYMSLWLGKSLEPGQGGELMFGGIDWSRMAGSLQWSQRKPTAADWSLVLDRGILVNGTRPLSHTPGALAVIDSGSDGIYLQRSDYDELFRQAPGAIKLSTGYWRVPCVGSTFLSVSIEGREYKLPYHDWVEHERPLSSTSTSEYPEDPNMSKRGTSEDHVSKEQYHYDHSGGGEGEEASIFGQFRQASTDEMAKRVIKQPRSRLSKANSTLSDDGSSRPNPFASIGSTTPASNLTAASTFTTSSPATSQPAAAKPNPFAAFSFPAATASSTSSSSRISSTPTTAATTTASSFSFTPSAVFSQPATTQSSSPALSSSITVKPVGSSREDYERALEALNTTFVRKVTKEIEKNPIANLAQVFGQYVDQRTKVKARFNEGTGESATKMAKKDPFSTPASGKPAFGNSISTNGSTSTTSTAPSTSTFSFGAPPKESDAAAKPAFSGFNFGVKADSTPASTTAASTTTPATTAAPLFGSFGGFGAKTGATAGSSTFSFGVPASSSSSSTSTATTTTASTGASSTPFSFNAAKPFSFNPPTSTPSTTSATGTDASAAPKPFSFQVPTQFGQGGGAAAATEDDKMPDDTKSNMVDNREGEEGESTVFEVRAKLYAFEGSEHKDLGVGQFRVNEVDATKKRRMIMRSGTGMLTLNSWVIQGMAPKRDKNTVTVFAIADGKPKRYALRVKTEDSAKELEAALAAGQQDGGSESKTGGEDQ